MPPRRSPGRDTPVLRSGRPARLNEVPEAWRELRSAHLLLRRAGAGLDRRASDHGWPVPFSPIRFLVLARLHGASAFGIRPRRLALELDLGPSSLAYHLDALEGAGLVDRRRRPAGHDGRRVAVRLTERGLAALWVLDRPVREAAGGATPR